jgi:hypothetical protein
MKFSTITAPLLLVASTVTGVLAVPTAAEATDLAALKALNAQTFDDSDLVILGYEEEQELAERDEDAAALEKRTKGYGKLWICKSPSEHDITTIGSMAGSQTSLNMIHSV